MVATNYATLKRGEAGNGRVEVPIGTSTLEQAADQLKVGRRTVARGKKVREHGHEDLIKAVEQGKVPVSLAAKLVAAVPDKKQQRRSMQAHRDSATSIPLVQYHLLLATSNSASHLAITPPSRSTFLTIARISSVLLGSLSSFTRNALSALCSMSTWLRSIRNMTCN